jgi:hypothetical protein
MSLIHTNHDRRRLGRNLLYLICVRSQILEPSLERRKFLVVGSVDVGDLWQNFWNLIARAQYNANAVISPELASSLPFA